MTNKHWLALILSIVLLTAGCASPETEITPIATAPATTSAGFILQVGNTVEASGVIEPADSVNLGLALPARVESIEVSEGDRVNQDDLLILVADHEQKAAALSAAESSLLEAQLALKDLQDGAGLALAQAKDRRAKALDALDDAQYEWSINQPGNRYTVSSLKDAKADVVLAEKRLAQARKNLEKASGTTAKAQARTALTEAERAYNQAVWLVDWLQSEPTEIEQALLDAELALAEAELLAAEDQVNQLKNGPDPDDLKLAESRIETAEKQLEAAQSSLADSEIRAPISGTVVNVPIKPGAVVSPGQILLTLADLDQFQVKTTDLSERDIDQVRIGQSVDILIEGLEVTVEGTVIEIGLQAETIGGDVVYPVTISLSDVPANTRWGMSVEVVIDSTDNE
jgi:multidrug efflux pump subunit AcrA (membrane-fusion protein)